MKTTLKIYSFLISDTFECYKYFILIILQLLELEMLAYARLLLSYFIIDSLKCASTLPRRDLLRNDILVDIHKGYALRRIGIYSSNFAEEIVHTFIPIHNLCITSPQTDICRYASIKTKTNAVKLATIMTSRPFFFSLMSYNLSRVAVLIEKDISRVLVQNHPRELIKKTNSVIHFINNEFHHYNDEENDLTTTSQTNDLYKTFTISCLSPTAIELVLKQININDIGLIFLSANQLKYFLKYILTMIDISYTVSSIEELINIFSDYIIGQSFFALRYCGFDEKPEVPSQACLVVSTLFLRNAYEVRSRFFIYKIIPLPITYEHNMNIYDKLPKLIGLNMIDDKIIVCNFDTELKECIFAMMVTCRVSPLSTSLSNSACLNQLFDQKKTDTVNCHVNQLMNINKDVMQLDNNLLLFYDVQNNHHCSISSSSMDAEQIVEITEPAILFLPCNRTTVCESSQPLKPSCTNRRIIIKQQHWSDIETIGNISFTLKHMSRTLFSSYQYQRAKQKRELTVFLGLDKTKFKKILDNFLTDTISLISFILVLIVCYMIQHAYTKNDRRMYSMECNLEEVINQ